uniref:Uncharacterized protein n=1 Tax=Ciona savignyi TaxID=51511 RepID=H2ZI76_CIOSA
MQRLLSTIGHLRGFIQPNTRGRRRKPSDLNNNNSGELQQGVTTLSPPNPCTSPTAQNPSPKPGAGQLEQAPKYSQMNTVTVATKEPTPGTEPMSGQHRPAAQKVPAHDENGIAWTPLQNASGDNYQHNSGAINTTMQSYQHYQQPNTTQTWSAVQQAWVSTSYHDQPLQVQLASDTTQPPHTSNNLIMIKGDNQTPREDGEIQIQDGTFTIPPSTTSMAYSQPPNVHHTSIIDVNKLSDNCLGDKGNCENIMLQVERLRIQHQQLQRLQLQQQAQHTGEEIRSPQMIVPTYVPQPPPPQHGEEPPRKKPK